MANDTFAAAVQVTGAHVSEWVVMVIAGTCRRCAKALASASYLRASFRGRCDDFGALFSVFPDVRSSTAVLAIDRELSMILRFVAPDLLAGVSYRGGDEVLLLFVIDYDD